MKYNINKKEKDIIEITIELGKDAWQTALDEAYNKTKGKYEVKGFRKGKAPRKAIENEYGSMVFVDEAIDEVYKKEYINIIQKEKLAPVSNPTLALDKCDDTGLKMTLTVQNKPTVTLGAYTDIEVKGKKADIKAKDVNDYLKNMAERNARKVEADKDAELAKGNIAVFDFVGTLNGEKFDGGSSENYELEIGSGRFVPGFEDQMVGLKVGEEKDLNITFPKEYTPELAGKDVVFHVKLNKIMVKEIPAMDDKWATMVSEFDTLEEFKKSVKEKLTKEAQTKLDDEATNKLIDEIVKNAKFEIPDCMIEDEINYILQDFEQKLAMQGLNLEKYAQIVKKDIKQIRDEQKDIAKTNCGIRVVLEAIIDKEKIKTTAKQVDAKIADYAKMYGQSAEDMKKNLGENEINYIQSQVLMDNLIEFLKKNNKIVQ